MTWVLLAVGSVFFFTALNLLQRTLAVGSKNPRAMAVLFNAIAALIALIIFILSGSLKNFTLPSDSRAWIGLLIATFCYGMFERWRFAASKLLEASVLTTIVNIGVLIAFVGSLFLYSEPLTISKVLGGSLILGALFLVSFNRVAKKSSRKGIFIGIAISVALGLAWALDKMGTGYFNPNTYSILVWAVPIIFIYFPHIKLDLIKVELKLATWKVFVLAGLNVAGYLMQLKAFEIAEATRVIPIVQTSTLFTILLGVLILKERDHILRKILAGLMAIIGAYFLI